MNLSDGAMHVMILGTSLLLGTAIIIIGTKNPEGFLKKRHTVFICEIIGEDDTIKLFRFIGKFSLLVGICTIAFAFFLNFIE